MNTSRPSTAIACTSPLKSPSAVHALPSHLARPRVATPAAPPAREKLPA
eukprot:CAMPEP_0180260224 /NCGR_PEP_ID=MMETSP0987-20121128/43463_1 /TAXON_ID=697907 /ORGANISM="non described non described, Strain CCMP2293" /LENGTH=48 /DNA_ID= /DNA_START= /DNA_END= /DNA_ORIENTATION=